MFAADIEKAFDSLDHNFILAALEKLGLENDFIQCVRTLLNDQQSCVMNQTAYIPGRYIGESVRLISDILEYTDRENCEGNMFAADIEKAFDSLDHNFILAVLEKMGFGNDFIQWVQTLLNDQQSCVMNNGTTTGYFNLNKGIRQGESLSAYLFALAIEVLFIMIRENVDIKGLNLFGTEVKLTICADDTTLSLKDLSSLKVLLQTFEKFERVASLKRDLVKSEICGIGVKKGCRWRSVDAKLLT